MLCWESDGFREQGLWFHLLQDAVHAEYTCALTVVLRARNEMLLWFGGVWGVLSPPKMRIFGFSFAGSTRENPSEELEIHSPTSWWEQKEMLSNMGGRKQMFFISEHHVHYIFEDAFDFDSIMACLCTTFTPISVTTSSKNCIWEGIFKENGATMKQSPPNKPNVDSFSISFF